MKTLVSRRLFGLVYLAIFAGSLFLYTRHNERPAVFHPAEPSKVELVTKSINNFYHPLLMVNTLRAAAHFLGAETPRQVVQLGRWVSASFAALAVLCFMAAAQLLRGRSEAILVGVLLGSCPMLLVNAHYLKEDTALLLGLGAAVLALVFHERAPSPLRLALLGAGCALAASGKWVGLLFTLCALPLVLVGTGSSNPPSRTGRFAFFLVGFVALFLVINMQVLALPRALIAGLRSEGHHVTTNHQGLVMPSWGTFYWLQIIRGLSFAFPVLLCVAAQAVNVLRRRSEPLVRQELCLLLWPLLYLLVVGASPVQAPRYILPVVALILFTAALGLRPLVEWSGQLLSRHGSGSGAAGSARGAAVASVMLLSLLSVTAFNGFRRCHQYLELFAHDSRMELEEWASRNIPAQAIVLADKTAWLHVDKVTEKRKDSPPRIDTLSRVGDMGSVAAIRAAGYDFVVVSSSAFDRYLNPAIRPDPERDFEPSEAERRITRMEERISNLDRHRRVRHCYEEIFAQLELVWSRTPAVKMDNAISPELRVYRVQPRDSRALEVAPPSAR